MLKRAFTPFKDPYLNTVTDIFNEISDRYGSAAPTNTRDDGRRTFLYHPLPLLGLVHLKSRPRPAGELVFSFPTKPQLHGDTMFELRLMPFSPEPSDVVEPVPTITIQAIRRVLPDQPQRSRNYFVVRWGSNPLDIREENRQKAPREIFDGFCGYVRQHEAEPYPQAYHLHY